jgi:phospholipid/cholesterol/gamma-HCH transport system substrate-binding protein
VEIKKEVKIGILVVVSIFAFVYGFNFLKGKNIFNPRSTYYAVYDNVNGLTKSNPVMIRGYSIGSVNNIYFLPDNPEKIVVEIKLKNSDIKIPKGTVALIRSSSLLGGMAIDLNFSKNNEYYTSGDTLLSDLESGLTDEISKQIIPVKDKAEKLISTVDSLIANINSIFNDNTKGNLRESVKTFNQIALDVQGMVAEERERLKKIADNVQSITQNLKDNNNQIQNILKNISNVTDSLAKANLASTVANANIALTEVAEVMTKINQGQGSLGLLVNDKKLYDNLDASSKDLDKLMIDIKENPKRYIHFSVFGRKEKKKVK